MPSAEFIASVIIATKNRKDNLFHALESSHSQTVPLEIIVIDDGSDDGTADAVIARFPMVKLFRSNQSAGYIAQRNRGARLATTPFIFSIDDDAAFSTPRVVEQTLTEFDDPRIGAVAIPFIEPLKGGRLMQQAPTRDRIWITDSFVGTAHALRRELFLEMGGYRENLVHQGEERDFCLRMLDAGWATRLGNSEPILHFESPHRDHSRMDYFGRKNDILFAWHNVPAQWLPVHLAATSLNGAYSAFKVRRFYSMAAGMFAGYRQCIRQWSERNPVAIRTYLLGRQLRKRGALPIEDVVSSKAGTTSALTPPAEPKLNEVCVATIMIPSRNRIAELERTLSVCLDQDWPALEILVVDDASTDGTFERVREKFPTVNIVRRELNEGSVAARNDVLRRAKGKYIIGLDDDSRFMDLDACRRVVERMEAEPDLGIVSFQVIGPENPERLTEAGRLHGEWHCSSFAACGVAIRRSMLEKTGLLPEFFFHAYEEPDLCLRAWNAGFRVLQWNEIVVHHEFSGLNRDEQLTHRRHARNEACSIWMRSPWHLVLPMTLARLAGQARYAASRGWLLSEPRVWAEFLWRLPRCLLSRQAVSTKAVKICVALNRMKVADPRLVWKLGELSWREILCGRSALELHKEVATTT